MSVEDLTNAAIPITLGGKDLLVHRLNDRDISDLTEWVRAQFIRTARTSLEGVTDSALRKETLELAMSKAAKMQWMFGEGASMMATPDGLARIIWQAAKQEHPDLSYDYVRSLMMKPGAVDTVRESLKQIKPKAPAQPVVKKGDPPRKRKRRRRRKN